MKMLNRETEISKFEKRMAEATDPAIKANLEVAKPYFGRRIELGLTKKQLAGKTGLSARTIRLFEFGKHRMIHDNLNMLREALDMPKLSYISISQRNEIVFQFIPTIKRLIRSNSYRLKINTASSEDMEQALLLEAIRAIDRYIDGNANLKTFVVANLENYAKTFLKKARLRGLGGRVDVSDIHVFSIEHLMECGFEL